MSSKVLVLFALLCILNSCWGGKDASRSALTRHDDVTIKPGEEAGPDDDVEKDGSFWRFWKFWNWGRSMLNKALTRSSDMAESASGRHRIHEDRLNSHSDKRKLKSKRTLTRRESSLVVTRGHQRSNELDDVLASGTNTHVPSFTGSATSFMTRPYGSIQKELVTLLFESMIPYIVDSWEVIATQKSEDNSVIVGKTVSDSTFTSKKKKSLRKVSKTKRSRSRLDDSDPGRSSTSIDPLLISWWSGSDEKAIIHFKNGNSYEGGISMKCMHGEGRFRWADGTVYMGQFVENEMKGTGRIEWKDDTWYEGEFAGNLRHGRGLFVKSRLQQSYSGGWDRGTKHGKGRMTYGGVYSYYEGDWDHNIRTGYGVRENERESGYKGKWDRSVKEGKGMMIWPQHHIYKGEWKNGTMDGWGLHIWDGYFNNTMALPVLTMYRGFWKDGKRNGFGSLRLGLGLGSFYEGEFKEDLKHGGGRFVTNNGQIIKDKRLFSQDNFTLSARRHNAEISRELLSRDELLHEPFHFNMSDSSIGLRNHILPLINSIGKQQKECEKIISHYLENNQKDEDVTPVKLDKSKQLHDTNELALLHDVVTFEERSLLRALKCYENEISDIFLTYATICNTEEIAFKPVLCRLYLWQLYYDCNIHEKGLTLVEIDNIYYEHQEWLPLTPHGPFEKMFLWQFQQSLISVASRLYAKPQLPGPKPDTIIAKAFRHFMNEDVLPNVGRRKGRFSRGYGAIVPLKALYKLYCTLGEPHTIRTFILAVRRLSFCKDDKPPELVEASDESLMIGHNIYVIDDEMSFIIDDQVHVFPSMENEFMKLPKDLKLYNFGNLPTKNIIKIFLKIFPQICENDKIVNLRIEITFLEFFEAFVACAEESIRVTVEEIYLQEKNMSSGTDLDINKPTFQ